MREIRLSRLAESCTDLSQRQHVAVRPASRLSVPLPQLAAVKHIKKKFPVVPEIIGDTPHIGIMFQMPGFFDHRRSRRERQAHRSPGLVDRAADHFYLCCPVWIIHIEMLMADVIHLHKIHSPVCIQLEDRVIIRLPCGGRRVNTVHIAVPAADRIRAGCLIRCRIGSKDRQPLMNCLSRNTTHDMDAELQPHGMNFVGDWSKTFSVCRRREPVWCRDLTPPCIQRERCELPIHNTLIFLTRCQRF